MHNWITPIIHPSATRYYLRMSRVFDSVSEAKDNAKRFSRQSHAPKLKSLYGFKISPLGREIVMELGNGSFWSKNGISEGVEALNLLHRFLSTEDIRDYYLQEKLALLELG